MFDIPSGEFERFSSYMQIYKQGAPIFVEGQQDDKGVFLLRYGRVGVYKQFEDERKLISTIEAVNFFGELSLISSGPRTVTIETLSDQVIVYGFRSSYVQALMANPKWGYMLSTRLIMNLKNANDQIVDLVSQNKVLKQELKLTQDHSVEIFSVLHDSHKAMMVGTIVNAREWQYISALNKLLENLVKQRLPELSEKLFAMTDSKWKQLHQDGSIPDILYNYIQEISSRKKT
jgi:CRP-like cAMP-binding protein